MTEIKNIASKGQSQFQNTTETNEMMTDIETMSVCKRTGEFEEVSFDKILKRIKKLSYGLHINPFELTQSIIKRIYNNISTAEIDELAANLCANKITQHPDYETLASRIAISNHHKNTSPSFSEVMTMLWNNKDVHGADCPIINEGLYNTTMENKEKINTVIKYENDYNYNYFGFKTLERSYLLKIDGKIVERPQQMLMRVALSIHKDNLKEAFKCYKIMSEKYFTHASPTLFNMGTLREQAFSCFLLQMKEDSMSGIFDTIKDCALISKWAGGIGVALHKIRAKGARIRGSNGVSDGLVPMLRVFNDTARYSNQSGRRAGSFAMYLEPWHADIEEFLMMKRNTGAEELRARDLFYAVWIPDLFMERVRDGGDWTLMCPDECPGLFNVYGDEFKELYERYESEGRGRKTIPADKIWRTIIDSQIETGTPYIVYKDAVNRKSNQKNLGVIQSSNLCAEICEYTAPDEHAVCCLASVSLPAFLKTPQLQEDEKMTVYTKNNCMYCSATKAYLKQLSITTEKINLVNIEDEPEQREQLIKKLMKEQVIAAECDGDACSIPENPSFTVPQIWIGSKYIGGYEQLLKSFRYEYDYTGLIETTKQVTRNLNKLIDYNYYPVPETERSNRRHRPIGIGVQGLADVFARLHIAFDSEEALELTAHISEAMYLGACQASMDLARKRKKHVQDYRRLLKKIASLEKETNLTEEQKNELEKSRVDAEKLKVEHFIYEDEVEKLPMCYAGAYSTFMGSPAYKGKLQFDLWREEQPLRFEPKYTEEWKQVKEDIKRNAMRNSLLMAMMPTASTSQILGNNECIEPYTNNIYKRRVNAGEFTVINQHLITDLINLGIWNQELKDKIIAANGSIQGLREIPAFIRNLYKTVWEIRQKWLIDHALVRSPYVCQTQSMNLFVSNPTPKVINAMHFYAWKNGLKTGIYYLRSLAKTQAQKFSIDLEKVKKSQQDEEEVCLSCSG